VAGTGAGAASWVTPDGVAVSTAFCRTATYAPPAAAVTQPAASKASTTGLEIMALLTPERFLTSKSYAPAVGRKQPGFR